MRTLNDKTLYTSAAFTPHREYWEKQLSVSGKPFRLNSFARPANNDTVSVKQETVTISGPDYKLLSGLVKNSDMGLFVVLVSGLGILFSRFCSETTVILHTPKINSEAHGNIPLVLPVSNASSLQQLLVETKQTAIDAFRFQDFPVAVLKDANAGESNILFTYDNIQTAVSEQEKYDLVIRACSNENELTFTFFYKTPGIEATFISSCSESYCKLLTAFANLQATIGSISLVTDKGLNLLKRFMSQEYQHSVSTIHALFEKAVEQFPDTIALAYENLSLTYSGLNDRANRLAGVLVHERGINPGDRIGVMLTRSADAVIALLAILKANAVYVPIDPAHPAERKKFIMEDAALKLALTHSDFMLNPELEGHQLFIMDIESDGISSGSALLPTGLPSDLAYVIYTSGTSGKPKGTMLEHAGFVNMILEQIRIFGIVPGDIVIQFASLSFDASLSEIFMALLSGAGLAIPGDAIAHDPQKLAEFLVAQKVNVATLPPVYASVFTEEQLQPLRVLITAGESAIRKDALRFAQTKKYFNAYGPTEISVCASICLVDKDFSGMNIPIGKPISNTKVYILDEQLQLLPPGAIGEIYIAGSGLARGYLNAPELTQQKFIPDPFEENARMYKSGDLGRWLSDGDIEFLGRKDLQVKIRGFRIEPAEIETALLSHQEISAAVVLPVVNAQGTNELAAYLVLQNEIPADQIRSFLAASLPAYMIPAHFVAVPSMPLTINGKIDSKALPDPFLAALKSGNAYAAPENEIQQAIVDVWQEVLSHSKISIDDNFFSLGGDSIKALKVIVMINKKLGSDADVSALFSFSTVRQLAESIAGSGNKANAALEKGNLLIDTIRNRILNNPEEAIKIPAGYEDIYPLTSIEKGMIYSSLLRPDEPVYHDQIPYQLEIKSIDVFMQALRLMCGKHSILRTLYYINEFSDQVKVVMPVTELPVTTEDISALSHEEQLTHVNRYIRSDHADGFVFNGKLLWRMRLFKLSSSIYYVIWSVHHSILDGWSNSVFNAEFSRLCSVETESMSVTPLKHSYKDYCAIMLARESSEETNHFWRERLAGYTRNKLPFNYTGKKISNETGMRSVNTVLEQELLEKLLDISAAQQVSFKSICLAAHIALLHITSSENDIVTGFVSHDRPPVEDAEKIIGCFLNTVPIRIDIHSCTNWMDLIKQVNAYLLEVKPHEIYLADIAKAVGDKPSTSNPVFDSIFNFMDFHELEKVLSDSGVALSGQQLLEEKELAPFNDMTNTLFDLEASKTLSNFTVKIKYAPAYFENENMQWALKAYERILRKIGGNIHATIDKSEFPEEEDHKRVVIDFNRTIIPYADQSLAHSIFEDQAAGNPHHPALCFGENQLSYEALNKRANRIARYLMYKGVKKGDNVGLISERNFHMIAGMLGILKAGAAYVPVEPSYPRDRQEYILNNSKISFLLTDENYPVTDAYSNCSGRLDDTGIDDLDDSLFPSPSHSSDLAYTIYTSGSTGKPKGVMIEHHSVVNLIQWVNTRFNINQHDRILLLTSMCFDLSVYDIFGGLAAGAAIVIIQNEEVQDPQILRSIIDQQKITFWNSVPTTMLHLVNAIEIDEPNYSNKTIRTVFLSGDWIPVSLPGKIKRFFPNAEVISLGGATEGTVWSNYYPVEKVTPLQTSIPYGVPIQNNFFYILDENQKPVPPGVAAELYIGGVGVAKGYANDIQKTNAAFFPDPFSPLPKASMYKTGDMGRILPDGNMEFLGRKDFQVKIRGFRVEMEEIETLLVKHEHIREAVVTDKTDNSGNKFLCAYIVAQQTIEDQQIKNYLARSLPEYMVPACFVRLGQLPMNSNGKIDRKALPEPEQEQKAELHYQPPVTKLQQQLAQLWMQVLAIPKIGITDNILEIGAHSLHVGAFVSRVHKLLNLKLSIRDVFSNPTISELEQVLTEKQTDLFESILPAPKAENYELSHSQKRLWMIDQMSGDSRFYNMTGAYWITGTLDIGAFKNAFQKLVLRHEILRTNFITLNGEPKQIINEKPVEEIVQLIQVPHLSDEEAKYQAEKDMDTPFDLENTQLIRAHLYLAPERTLFIFTMHHIISDGWSMSIIIKELAELYAASYKAETGSLQPLHIQYKDYAAWQNNFLSGGAADASRDYWKKKLANLPVQKLRLSGEKEKTSFAGSNYTFSLGGKTFEALKQLSLEQGSGLYNTLLAGIYVLLYRYTGQHDIVIGTPVSGRDHLSLENQVGFYVNMLPLRNTINGSNSFTKVFADIKENVLNDMEHQYYPFDKMVSNLMLQRTNLTNPLFDIGFTWVNRNENLVLQLDELNTGFGIQPLEMDKVYAKADLWFYGYEREDHVDILIEYSNDLYTAAQVESIAENLVTVLSSDMSLPLDQIMLNNREAIQDSGYENVQFHF